MNVQFKIRRNINYLQQKQTEWHLDWQLIYSIYCFQHHILSTKPLVYSNFSNSNCFSFVLSMSHFSFPFKEILQWQSQIAQRQHNIPPQFASVNRELKLSVFISPNNYINQVNYFDPANKNKQFNNIPLEWRNFLCGVVRKYHYDKIYIHQMFRCSQNCCC